MEKGMETELESGTEVKPKKAALDSIRRHLIRHRRKQSTTALQSACMKKVVAVYLHSLLSASAHAAFNQSSLLDIQKPKRNRLM